MYGLYNRQGTGIDGGEIKISNEFPSPYLAGPNNSEVVGYPLDYPYTSAKHPGGQIAQVHA